MKRKILITGGAGFIGSCLAEKLLVDEDNFVVLVDDLSTGEIRKLPQNNTERLRFIKADANNYREISEVMLLNQFDYVFHFSAVVGVARTQQNPVKVLKDLSSFEHILSICKNSGVKRVFFSSSSEVYGDPAEYPQNEYTTPLNSRVPYAVVKNAGESYFRSFNLEFGLNYTVFRFFNTYGPKQSKDFVISKFIANALQNKDIPIYGDGSQIRTFCYIDDNIDACLKIAYEDLYINDVINIGNDIEISILELANLIISLTHSKSKIIHLPPLKEGDMVRRCPDISKMKLLLKRDLIPVEEGIKKILSNTQFII